MVVVALVELVVLVLAELLVPVLVIVLQFSNQQAPCACVVASKLVGKHMPIAQQHSVRKPRTGLHVCQHQWP